MIRYSFDIWDPSYCGCGLFGRCLGNFSVLGEFHSRIIRLAAGEGYDLQFRRVPKSLACDSALWWCAAAERGCWWEAIEEVVRRASASNASFFVSRGSYWQTEIAVHGYVQNLPRQMVCLAALTNRSQPAAHHCVGAASVHRFGLRSFGKDSELSPAYKMPLCDISRTAVEIVRQVLAETHREAGWMDDCTHHCALSTRDNLNFPEREAQQITSKTREKAQVLNFECRSIFHHGTNHAKSMILRHTRWKQQNKTINLP